MEDIMVFEDNNCKISLNDQSNEQFEFVGKSLAVQKMMEKLRAVVQNDSATCLICGESGTGKELIARMIHQLSNRRDKPLVIFDCPGIPKNLFVGALKGIAQGKHQQTGQFQLAGKGILFLNEISEMPFNAQKELLEILQNRAILPIGSNSAIPLDVRVIASTNRDLQERVEKGKFLKELYQHLAQVKIELPPLRERWGDVALLVKYLLEKVNYKINRYTEISQSALSILAEYRFPGNVRELRNILYSAALVCNDNIITVNDIILNLDANALNPFVNELPVLIC